MNYSNPSRVRTPKITVLPGPSESSPPSNRRLYLGIAGGALAALLVGGGLKLWQSQQASQLAAPADDPSTAVTNDTVANAPDDVATVDIDPNQTTAFASPFLAAEPALPPSAPTLLQSTPSQGRVPTVAAGRPDPFAPLVIPTGTPARPTPALVAAPPPPPPPTPMAQRALAPVAPLPTVPATVTQSLPPLPTVTVSSLPVPPIPGGVAPLPGIAAAPSAPVVQSAVDEVMVSGIVQIGQQVHAIVTEPGSPSGRRVSQGDTLAGGQVRVKAIDLSSTDPAVVLTYNGRDYYRTVSSAGVR